MRPPYFQIPENQSSLSVEAKPPTGVLALFASVSVILFFSFAIFLTEIKENDKVSTATTIRDVIIFVFMVVMIIF